MKMWTPVTEIAILPSSDDSWWNIYSMNTKLGDQNLIKIINYIGTDGALDYIKERIRHAICRL